MGKPAAALCLILSGIERSSMMPLIIQTPISQKGVELEHNICCCQILRGSHIWCLAAPAD